MSLKLMWIVAIIMVVSLWAIAIWKVCKDKAARTTLDDHYRDLEL